MLATQEAVYDTLDKYGPLPDHVLVPILQHENRAPWQSSSGIRTRRNELTKKGYLKKDGAVVMPSGRQAITYTTTKKKFKRS